MSVSKSKIRLALPKGRMQSEVFKLLDEAGIKISAGDRDYRPSIALDGYEVKILKPQNIIEMLNAGSRDVGFAGADWVSELNADLVAILDAALDPVTLVAAAPASLLENGELKKKKLVVASEYERITRKWILSKGLDATFVKSFGATEVFPPEDADVIVDNTATGATLRSNNLVIIDELMFSTTRMYASRAAASDPVKKAEIDRLAMLVKSVMDARTRVMLEANVAPQFLEAVVSALPCMRQPTISALHNAAGYAVKAAVPKKTLTALIPELKKAGATDIVVAQINQIVA